MAKDKGRALKKENAFKETCPDLWVSLWAGESLHRALFQLEGLKALYKTSEEYSSFLY